MKIVRWGLLLVIFGGVFLLVLSLLNRSKVPENTTFQLEVPIVAETKEEISITEEVLPVNTQEVDQKATVKFVVVSDFDGDIGPSAQVANAIAKAKPNYLLTAGDNGHGLVPYDRLSPVYTQYHDEKTMFPALGNHDLYGADYAPYDMNNLPLNQHFDYLKGSRYYSRKLGSDKLVEVFFLNSSDLEPDGNTENSAQAQWLRSALAKSKTDFQIVILHEPPFASCDRYGTPYEGNPNVRWPFADWGADLVISGHCHNYERLAIEGIPYVVIGIGGGGAVNGFASILPESQVRREGTYGYMAVEASASTMKVEIRSEDGETIDSFEVKK